MCLEKKYQMKYQFFLFCLFRDFYAISFFSFPGTKMFDDRNFLNHCFDFLADQAQNLPPYSQYIVIDANSRSSLPRNMLVRSNVFPDEKGDINPVFFFPKN